MLINSFISTNDVEFGAIVADTSVAAVLVAAMLVAAESVACGAPVGLGVMVAELGGVDVLIGVGSGSSCDRVAGRINNLDCIVSSIWLTTATFSVSGDHKISRLLAKPKVSFHKRPCLTMG